MDLKYEIVIIEVAYDSQQNIQNLALQVYYRLKN